MNCQTQLRRCAMPVSMKRFLRDESGATAIEYTLIATLISVAIIVGALALGTKLNTVFNSIATAIPAAA
jgi:pilus assembly protein Flp/PilA